MNSFEIESDRIRAMVIAVHRPREYRDFTHSLLSPYMAPNPSLPKLLGYLEGETDFFFAPASTRFHGCEECGLIRHSLLVAANALKLAPIMLEGEIDRYHLLISSVFHDFCKVNMYEKYQRNVKNEATGQWEARDAFRVRADYLSYGHGIESMLRLNRFIPMPEAWNQAIRWHMGAFDISPNDKPAFDKALGKYREVLLLQTADMMAGLVDAI